MYCSMGVGGLYIWWGWVMNVWAAPTILLSVQNTDCPLKSKHLIHFRTSTVACKLYVCRYVCRYVFMCVYVPVHIHTYIPEPKAAT